jgi:hypothetical protein
MKQMSALLTLLLAVLLTGPPSGPDVGSGRYLATALAELDLAQGAASLNGKPAAREVAGRDADEDSVSGEPAILPPFSHGPNAGPGRYARPASGSAPAPAAPFAYRARAPPTM